MRSRIYLAGQMAAEQRSRVFVKLGVVAGPFGWKGGQFGRFRVV